MKKTICFVLIIAMCFLSGCASVDSEQHDVSSGVVSASSDDADSSSDFVPPGSMPSEEEPDEPPFTMAFQDRTVIFRMPMPKQEYQVQFGDFTLSIRTNQDVNYDDLGYFQEIIFDVMYTYINSGAVIEPALGWESTWSNNNTFIKVDIPLKTTDNLSDGSNDILIDWSKLRSPHSIILAEMEDGQINYRKPQSEFEYDDVVVPFSDLENQYQDAWLEQRLQQHENPLPERGNLFQLPDDFGYEYHESDKSYFFCYSDDYIVTKFDLRDIYVDSSVIGQADMYIAYNFEPDDNNRSWFEMVKFVLEDHQQALQFVRELDDIAELSIANICEYIVDDNVVYPYYIDVPLEGLAWEDFHRLQWGYNLPYAAGPDDMAWLYPSSGTLRGLHPAAVRRPDGTIQYFSKETMIIEWEKAIANGTISKGQFYASNP